MSNINDRNQEATVYVGNLDERCTEAIVWELMLQVGPIVNVHLPKDRVTQSHQGYGFCEFATEEDADYCIKIMNMIKLYGKPIRVNKATADKKSLDVGANLFIGNLDSDVDEKSLYDIFSAFGPLTLPPKIGRDPESGESKGYGFINYDNFDSSDAAIDAMNGRFIANREVSVTYAFKKDGKGERHGSAAERMLATQAKRNNPDVQQRAFDPRASAPASSNNNSLPPPPSYPMPPQHFPPQQGYAPPQGNFFPPNRSFY